MALSHEQCRAIRHAEDAIRDESGDYLNYRESEEVAARLVRAFGMVPQCYPDEDDLTDPNDSTIRWLNFDDED